MAQPIPLDSVHTGGPMSSARSHSELTAEVLHELVEHLRQKPYSIARRMGEADHGGPSADCHD